MDEHYREIIAHYREAAFNHRLDLFLAYRDLRSEFDLIDQKEPPPDSSALLQWSSPRLLAKIKKFVAATTELLKRKRSTVQA